MSEEKQVKSRCERGGYSCDQDGSTKFWDLQTGQETAEAVPEGFTFPKQGGAQEQRINLVQYSGLLSCTTADTFISTNTCRYMHGAIE